MDDEIQIGQVDAACGHVGGHANAGTAVTHGLQRIGALGLAEFARERNNGKAAIGQAAGQMLDRFAGRTEDDGVLGIVKQQRIDDRIFATA
ncbi:hypothetical protein BLX88_04480 [Bacillus obstructivus]|nr:hypothetical protein BLX88_04480 [Bacillus obstructivus]